MEYYLHLVHPYGFFDWFSSVDILHWKKKFLRCFRVFSEVDYEIITYRRFIDFDNPGVEEVKATMELVNLVPIREPAKEFVLPNSGVPFDGTNCYEQGIQFLSTDEEVTEHYVSLDPVRQFYIGGGYPETVVEFADWMNNIHRENAPVLVDLVACESDDEKQDFIMNLFKRNIPVKKLSSLEREIKYQ